MLRNAVSAVRPARAHICCSFSTTVRCRKDFVQEIYLKELKSYKAPPQAKDAHVGAVKPFSALSVPKSPQLPSDLASELSKYEAQEPVLASSVSTPSGSSDEFEGGAKEFLAFLEQDIPKPAHHH